MTNINPFSKYFFLSGERLSTAKRVFKADFILVVSLGITVIAGVTALPDSRDIILWALLIILVVWTVLRLARGETYTQLRIKEAHASRQSASSALDDLNKFAESLKVDK